MVDLCYASQKVEIVSGRSRVSLVYEKKIPADSYGCFFRGGKVLFYVAIDCKESVK